MISDAAFHSQLKRLLWRMAHVNISRYTSDTTWLSGQDGRMSRCHTRVILSVREEGSKGSEQILEIGLGGEFNIIYINNCSYVQYLYFKARSLALFGEVWLNLDSDFRAIHGVGACLSQWDSSNDIDPLNRKAKLSVRSFLLEMLELYVGFPPWAMPRSSL